MMELPPRDEENQVGEEQSREAPLPQVNVEEEHPPVMASSSQVDNIFLSTQSSSLSKDQVALTIQRAARDSRFGDGASQQLNEVLLYRALCAAGSWAYGVMASEVWIFNHALGVLERPPGGFWRDTVFPDSGALIRIEDSSHPEYVPSLPLSPGEGLAGALWAEAASPALLRAKSRRHALDTHNDDDEDGVFKFRKVVWRNVKALANDPDQPPNERLALLGKAGFDLAAGVSFNVRGTKGIVVYMARGSANPSKLQSPDNEAYLISAADLIGAEAALAHSRAIAIERRVADRRETMARARQKIKTAMWMYRQRKHGDPNGPTPEPPSFAEEENVHADEAEPPKPSCLEWTHNFVSQQAIKAMGKDVNPPPRAPVQQWLVAFLGSIATLMAIARLNMWVKWASDNDLAIIMGPIAAQTALQYGLTAAPSAQPRCAIYGQLISITVAMILTYIPVLGGFTPWMRPAMATSIAITIMVALGMVHPPGAATAFLFASGKNPWSHLGVLLAAYAISIVMSVIINNWFDQRQYPIYWAWTHGTPLHGFDPRNLFGSKKTTPEEPKPLEKPEKV